MTVERPCRLLVTGASGVGSTTLGAMLAREWSVPHADTDDYFWEPTDPPYTARRPPQERVELMRRIFLPRPAWVLSGSIMGWPDEPGEHLDAVVFIRLDPQVRIARLVEREHRRYGAQIQPGRSLHEAHREFLTWAAGYDDESFEGRNIADHLAWVDSTGVPVLHLDGARAPGSLVGDVNAWLPEATP